MRVSFHSAIAALLYLGLASASAPRPAPDVVRVEGATFLLGCEPQDVDCGADERPGRRVAIASLSLARTEVTVSAYSRCVTEGVCTSPSTGGACNWHVAGREQHPVNCVDWTQATAYCAFMGGRLPTAEEWELAAKGGESRIYPWGDEPVTDRRANFADAQYTKQYPRAFDIPGQDDGWIETAPVGTYPAGASKQGALDLVGNVAEWTASEYLTGQYELRGGSWATETSSRRLRASYRTGRPPTYWQATVGFRCRFPAPAK
jgi:formylglycine-generating enzyme required for sulfatase activity